MLKFHKPLPRHTGRRRAPVPESKICVVCGGAFGRRESPLEARAVYLRREVCSPACSQRAESVRWAKERADAATPCLQCGAPTRPDKPSHTKKFCSLRCAFAHQKAHRPARPICPICHQKPRLRWLQTCSKRCGYELRKRKSRDPIKCARCGREFWPKRQARGWEKHCSWRCLHEAMREHKTRIKCLRCGAIVLRTPATVRRVKHHFCSNGCAKAYLRGPNSPHYRGESDPNRGGQWRRLAEEIRKRDGYCCQRCTRTQAENGQKLSVDHIVPWRTFADKTEANHPTNLVSLCRGCHSTKTHVYERLWLKGDCIGMEQYRKAIQLPPLFAAVEVPA